MRGSNNEGSKWGWQQEQAAITMAGAMTTSARREQQRVQASTRVDAMRWQQQ